MRILITGGGTGGHLYPALAVADALKAQSPDLKILFVGSERGMEKEQVPEAGHEFQALNVVGFPRRPGLGSLRAAFSFLGAIQEAKKLLTTFAPDVIFSTGGYASSPIVVAAWMKKLPIVLQEQNSVPGLTNRVASRLAKEVHLAFACSRRFFPKRRHLRLSGNPLRGQITQGSRQRALRLFRLEEDAATVLVLGGSQGARSINEAILDCLPLFTGRTDVQFVIQTGNLDHDRVMERCQNVQVRTWVRRFISNVGDAYAAADLVVCRAGAMTLSELCACGLPSILIPYPHATANHQWINAEQLAEGGAAVLLADRNLSGAVLHEKIEECLQDRRKLREMSVNALRLARPDATERLVRALGKYLPGFEPPPDSTPPRGRPERRPGERPEGRRDNAPDRRGPPDRRGNGERRGGGPRPGPGGERRGGRGPNPRDGRAGRPDPARRPEPRSAASTAGSAAESSKVAQGGSP
ncbi:MAG: undecaprenyldiphospho-muramoylpentapeptide beta-N-acetylglucosaminyltransferase [Candidatus Eisenbacteria bacterium]